MNQMSKSVLLMLKAEWKVASATLALIAKLLSSGLMAGSKPEKWQTIAKKGLIRSSTQKTPTALKLR